MVFLVLYSISQHLFKDKGEKKFLSLSRAIAYLLSMLVVVVYA